jgi:hypothetical protein
VCAGLMRYRTRSGFDYFGFYENDKQVFNAQSPLYRHIYKPL